ncbi:MAG: haloacid dehalogenase-like hydrolase [Firmicutes bacterium]|nr:haloacid dehalogenase-like hydrolase [Bacillota bacterium]
MTQRLLSTVGRALTALTGPELKEAIRLSEGRSLVAELVVTAPPLVDGISNAELAAAFGADILLLNFYDVNHPTISGLPGADARTVKTLCGRPVGINLEPSLRVPPGRRATPENAQKAAEQGVDLILITGNPETGVDTAGVIEAARSIRAALGSRILLAAGRMHAAGVSAEAGADLTPVGAVRELSQVADIVLVPAPGTVPGMTVEAVRNLVQAVHQGGALAMTAVGTSQEGADTETIRQIALWAKMTGADLHHIGDSGYQGVALPENILAYSLAIRGRRHTYRRMAASILR